MDLSRYLVVLRKWWWLLFAATALAAVSSYYAVSQQPSVYQARTVLMLGRTLENPNPSGNELSLSQQLAATYADFANMRMVREETMAALGLTWLPNYRAQTLPNSQLIEIVVTDTSPERAQAVANELARQLILRSPTTPRPEDQERVAFVSEQLSNLQQNIEETEDEIAAKRIELENAFSARDIQRLEGEIFALEDKLTTLRGNYAALLSNTSDGAINTLAVLEPANLPARPIGPARTMTVFAASAIGFFLAALAALFLGYVDDTIRTADDIWPITDVPVLPGIPKFGRKNAERELIVRTDPLSQTAETFRALVTAILAHKGEQGFRSLLITSPKPNEGKSLMVANLALAMAQSGHKVLIIDADLRHPVQHKLFEVSNEKGLANLLPMGGIDSEGVDLNGLLAEIVHPLPESGLYLLSSGSHRTASPAAFSLPAMRTVLAALSDRYDFIVLDSPPLLSVADAVVLGTQADRVLLIAGAGVVRRGELGEAILRLRDVDSTVLGVSLNSLDPGKTTYYAYYEHYFRHQEQSDDEGKTVLSIRPDPLSR